jgi:DNA modification methylase
VSGSFEVICGDALEVLRGLPDGLVQCCVTSPPYWGLRDYGVPPRTWGGDEGCPHEWGRHERGRRSDLLPAGQTKSTARLGIDHRQCRAGLEGGRFCLRCGAWRGCLGLEPSPELYVAHLVAVFSEVRRVLRDDGTLWLVLGDTYAAARCHQAPDRKRHHPGQLPALALPDGTKPKDLLGIPWQLAFALRADGWWLRSDVIWHKQNPIPESVRDRPTRAHEYVFLLAKRARYFYDHHAIRKPDCGRPAGNGYLRPERLTYRDRHGARGQSGRWHPGGGRNRRDVWSITSRPYRGGHIATFPPDLAEPCVLASSSPAACRTCGKPYKRTGEGLSPDCAHREPGGCCLVLDPFCGSGTTGLVALRHGRSFLGIELGAHYAQVARSRVASAREGAA